MVTILDHLIITHYQRLLNYIEPDVVHIMMDGRVVMTGDASLARRLKLKDTKESVKN